jgi:hypothetical protein
MPLEQRGTIGWTTPFLGIQDGRQDLVEPLLGFARRLRVFAHAVHSKRSPPIQRGAGASAEGHVKRSRIIAG